MVDSQDAGGLGAPEDNQVAQDQSIRNEDESGWGTGLPEALLVPVFQELENNPIGGPACARLACRRWAQAFRAAWLRLTPPGDMPPTSGGWQRSFPSLTELDLGQCGKMLPTFLDGAVWLTNLKTLCLPQETTEADLEPLEHLSASLVSLSLRHCWALSDGGLSALAPLTCLGLLDLFGCQRITEEGLTALADLPLRSLDVGRCGIGSLGPVAALQGLRTLGLSYCRGLGDRHLAALAPLAASLTSLDVFECTGLTDEAGAELAALTGLRELHLAIGDTLTDEGVQHLRPLTCLRVLNLYATGVTHSALEALAPALSGTLEVLNLDKTLASSDEGIEALAPALAGTLTSLSLAHGLVTDSGLRAVRRMHLLRTLSLRGNSYVTDAGVRELGCLPLTSLDLSFCHGVSASGLEELPASLEELSLEGCHEITGDAFRPLGRLNRLRLLNLEMCDGVHGIEDGIDELLNAADGSLEVIL